MSCRYYTIHVTVAWLYLQSMGVNGKYLKKPRMSLHQAAYHVNVFAASKDGARENAVMDVAGTFAVQDKEWGGFADVSAVETRQQITGLWQESDIIAGELIYNESGD